MQRQTTLNKKHIFKHFLKRKTKSKNYVEYDRRLRKMSARRYFSTVEKSVKKVFNYSIDIIDSIHPSNIDFSNIVVQETNDARYRGALLYDIKGIPYCLEVSKQNNEQPITIFHEIGHLVDIMGVGIPGQFESAETNGLFTTLLNAANNTPEIKKLNNIIASGNIQIGKNLLPLSSNLRGTLNYLNEPHEILARTYAQYIAERSKSKKVLKMLQNRRKESKFGEQWTEKNFEPLMQEWDNVLNKIGWHVKK